MSKKKKIAFFIIIILVLVVTVLINIKKINKKLYPDKYSALVLTYSKQYNLNPNIIFGVIKAESDFNPSAKSHSEAIGLMQITPPTAQWIAEKMKMKDFDNDKLVDPETNISMGCWYINNLNEEFKNMDLALAAYNGGRGNVRKWLGNKQYSSDGKILQNIPFKETDEYLKKIKVNVKMYEKLYDYGSKNPSKNIE